MRPSSSPLPASPALRTPARAALALALLCLLAGPAAAQWKWRDANGQITASDRAPPKEVPAKDILQRPDATTAVRRPAAAAPAAPAASAPTAGTPATPAKGSLEAEVDARKRNADQEAAAKAKAEEEKLAVQRAENCRRARAHIAALETGQRMARTNEKGEREVLDDKGRAEEMRAAREVIASDCR